MCGCRDRILLPRWRGRGAHTQFRVHLLSNIGSFGAHSKVFFSSFHHFDVTQTGERRPKILFPHFLPPSFSPRPIAFSSSLDHFGAPSNDGKKIECTTPLVCLHIFNQWKDGRKRDRGRRGCIFRFLPLPTILDKWKKFVSLNEILVDVW